MKFQIVVPSVRGWPHGQMYKEVAETLVHGFKALKHQAEISLNDFTNDATNVVLGSYDLPDAMALNLPPEAVLYNLEQIRDELLVTRPHFKAMLARHEVWDYSRQNVERLRGINHTYPLGSGRPLN